MPGHIRAFLFIAFIAVVVLLIARVPATHQAMADRDYLRRRNLWIGLTCLAFLSHNFWIFMLGTVFALYLAQKRDGNPLGMFFFLMCALPAIPKAISAAGLWLFDIHYVRALELCVLLPAFLYLRRQRDTEAFGSLLPDKFFIGYLVLDFLLMFEHRNATGILREGVLYLFIDAFLPYYVASRSLRNLAMFREAVMCFVVAALVASGILFFEFLALWLLYAPLEGALGVNWGWNPYVIRSGLVRASGAFGHPLAAGFAMAVAFSFYLYLRKCVPTKWWWLGLSLMALGLLGPFSRGPWMGAALVLLVYIATGPKAGVGFARLGLLLLLCTPILFTPTGEKIIDHMPFIGTVDQGNVTGRQMLVQAAINVFWQHPFLGTYDFAHAEALQHLRGDDGQVDLVNTYLVVALGRGGVGLFLFAGVFLSAIGLVAAAMRRQPSRDDERYVLGQALLAALLATVMVIATVSPILLVPTLYWSLAGLGASYACLAAREAKAGAQEPAPKEGPNRQGPNRNPERDPRGIRGRPARGMVAGAPRRA